jgi:hypothetical protein
MKEPDSDTLQVRLKRTEAVTNLVFLTKGQRDDPDQVLDNI